MKVLVIGGGGREHALVWAIRKSTRVTEVVCAPGNGGIEEIARCIPANVGVIDDLLRIAAAEKPDLTVVGPELPLSLGIVDALQSYGFVVFGPKRAAAMLETSKVFAKEFMKRHNIPTAHYVVCSSAAEVAHNLHCFHTPIVVKADGLAAGKGVLICDSREQAQQAANQLFSGTLLGSVEHTVVLEEFLVGEELSFLVMTDGKHAVPLVAAQDHKRIGEGDTGPNTGGMGAYSTNDLLDAHMRDWLMTHIVQPVVDGMAAEGVPFAGILYCGLMMTARGPMVLEFNARFGDPETQAVLRRLESDIVDALEAASIGRLVETELAWSSDPSVCVIAASGGYPGKYAVGKHIRGLQEAAGVEGVEVFHSGTQSGNDGVISAGGRVLAVTAVARTLPEAANHAYRAMGMIHFDDMVYRRDIGHRALSKRKKQ
jgi:phosphoribosylamine---glycine ligase